MSLPERQRQAILLREWQGLSHGEIAERLEITHSAAETLIFRARRSLADALENPGKRSRFKALHVLDLGGLLSALKGLLAGRCRREGRDGGHGRRSDHGDRGRDRSGRPFGQRRARLHRRPGERLRSGAAGRSAYRRGDPVFGVRTGCTTPGHLGRAGVRP